jgi:hypothetical protein
VSVVTEQPRAASDDYEHPRLRAVIEDLERTGAAAELLDREWRLVWASDEPPGVEEKAPRDAGALAVADASQGSED